MDEDDYDFQMEAKAYERTGPSGKLAELLSGQTKDKRKESPTDRFLIAVDAISREFESNGIAKISDSDITKMLEKSQDISDIKYKNPTCWILGYLASSGGSSLDKKRVLKVIDDILPQISKSDGVEAPDVIRYARFWRLFL
jgi:Family of unknown function (DUF5770)